ncbi:5-oxoprolinase subunit C family protein [Pseudozobellia thermophila]|uniref:Biotin-dependent carboxylase uncharacterized domain-containing protein n=1 Tax=Pseudozobellia thermophila TaxID=192903 RepID=A0A1M6N5T3_9FLAO|nr:biotin-dependent carboxyltransferase family protein [Pseudozobellia thermophila]SHJ91012.1 biotin-dependent carboxylase uncharacterized domain-containing protein [Pseudozobellia thermophila]
MLKVLKAGLFTTIQDQGRFGLLNKGVPVAGYMDTYSASKVNALLENQPDAAVMEITMTGPSLQFDQDTYICLGGADIPASLNNGQVDRYKVTKIKKGDILTFGKLQRGFRGYLAVKNGFQTPVVLGSRSFFIPVTPKDHLKKGDTVAYTKVSHFDPKVSELKVDSFLGENVLYVTQGPEYELLDDKQLEVLFSKAFTVSNENNRMAYQLEEKLPGHAISMLTSATLPGTVQLTPSGKLIVLMKDGQTTGGYPRILQLSDEAISLMAQKKYGDKVRFKLRKP